MTSPRTRRDVVAAAGVTIWSVGLAGCSSLTGGSNETPGGTATSRTDTQAPDPSGERSGVASLSVTDTERTYAVMGSDDATETATLYGGWKCPYTAEFVTTMLPAVVEDYVQPGHLAIEFRAVRFQADESWGDDEPRSNRAGQAVWHEMPKQFPAYVDTLFSNQPSEQTEWATLETLVGLAEQAGIDATEPIEQSVTAGEYTAHWKDTMDVIREKGIEGIPRFELGGEITAPILEPDAMDAQLERVVE